MYKQFSSCLSCKGCYYYYYYYCYYRICQACFLNRTRAKRQSLNLRSESLQREWTEGGGGQRHRQLLPIVQSHDVAAASKKHTNCLLSLNKSCIPEMILISRDGAAQVFLRYSAISLRASKQMKERQRNISNNQWNSAGAKKTQEIHAIKTIQQAVVLPTQLVLATLLWGREAERPIWEDPSFMPLIQVGWKNQRKCIQCNGE